MSASMKECLQLQLLEMEMLFSMFPNQGEVKLEDDEHKEILGRHKGGLATKNRICDHPADRGAQGRCPELFSLLPGSRILLKTRGA